MNCKKFHELISEEVEGLLNNDELLQLNEHCKNCVLCRKKRINETKSHNICATPEIKSTKKAKFKIILSILLVIIVFLLLFLFFIKSTDRDINETDISATKEEKIEKTVIQQKPTYTPPKEDIQETPEENSQIINKEPIQPSGIYEPEPQHEPVPPPEDANNLPVQEEAVETVNFPDDEMKFPEIQEDESATYTDETVVIEEPENIDVISSENSRNEIFDAIHAASPKTETVSADSDFELELTKEEFSEIVKYLNISETEFVISKMPEGEAVIASFVFKKEITEEPEPEEYHDSQKNSTEESSEIISENIEIINKETDQQ